MHHLTKLLLGAFMVASTIAVTPAFAAYPDAPIKVIIPFAPGAGTDLLFRTIAPTLERELGQRLIIDNRSGAGTDIGTEMAARAPADGYTLMVNTTPLLVRPLLNPATKYSFERDFIGIASLARTQIVLVTTTKNNSFKDLDQFIAYARRNPGRLNFGGTGAGTPLDLMADLLQRRASFKVTTAPYRGLGPILTDLVAGTIDFTFTSPLSMKGFVDSGQLTPLAITGRVRQAGHPDLPTFAEKGVDMTPLADGTWWGIFAPAGTPDAISRTLGEATERALKSPELQQRMIDAGYIPATGESRQFNNDLRQETARWKQHFGK